MLSHKIYCVSPGRYPLELNKKKYRLQNGLQSNALINKSVILKIVVCKETNVPEAYYFINRQNYLQFQI